MNLISEYLYELSKKWFFIVQFKIYYENNMKNLSKKPLKKSWYNTKVIIWKNIEWIIEEVNQK